MKLITCNVRFSMLWRFMLGRYTFTAIAGPAYDPRPVRSTSLHPVNALLQLVPRASDLKEAIHCYTL